MPAGLEAITLQFTLRRLGLLARTSLDSVAFSFLPFTCHSYENLAALSQFPRTQVSVLPEWVTLGPLTLRGTTAGLPVRQSLPPPSFI